MREKYESLSLTVLKDLAKARGLKGLTGLKKEQIVAEDGVDITYTLLGVVTHNRWTWDEITAIHMDSLRARPNVRMQFAKDGNGRMFLLRPEDCKEILQLVKQVRPDLEVTDLADKQKL